jgi:hypothetical protein
MCVSVLLCAAMDIGVYKSGPILCRGVSGRSKLQGKKEGTHKCRRGHL